MKPKHEDNEWGISLDDESQSVEQPVYQEAPKEEKPIKVEPTKSEQSTTQVASSQSLSELMQQMKNL